MDVSYEWLQELVDVPVTPEELADKVSRTGIEVANVHHPDKGLKKIVVGHILSMEPHPDSDHLQVTQVDVGEEEPRQIICGAPNVAAGQTVIVALPGARIADNIKIKKGKIRGVESLGMICALQEIGYPENVVPKAYAKGIYVFNEALKPGSDALAALGMTDAILDFEITPNRADALGMRGVAWEVGATYGNVPHFNDGDVNETGKPVSDYLSAVVDNPEDAPSYQMRVIDNVTIKESPLWLQRRLWNAGIRPTNNVVDVTNLIMLGFGQPLHAFDYDALGSKEIRVRRAQAQEKFTTLDGNEHELDTEDIVITNGQQPVALAGVMGGLNSEVTDGTKTVVLESAKFAPVNVRKTALKYNLRSQASARFEKGIDVASINEALDQAARLIAELSDGDIAQGHISATAIKAEDTIVNITLARINHVLGTDLDVTAVTKIFEQLGFGVRVEDGLFSVAVPPRRWDIAIEADLIEEVARIYGYDNLPSTLPTTTLTIGELTPVQARIKRSRQLLEASGLTQAISYGLTSSEKAEWFKLQASEATVLDFPMTEDHKVLRMNLVSGLLDAIAYNVARSEKNVALYEQGRVFLTSTGHTRPTEREYLAGAITGEVIDKTWHETSASVDFYYIKGIVERLLNDFNLVEPVTYQADSSDDRMHPGQTASIYLGSQKIGLVGRLHPAFEREQGLPATFVFEIDLEPLFVADKNAIIAQPAPKYPSMTRDMALMVAESVTNDQIESVIRAHSGKFLQAITLFDVYAGEHIEAGQKSLAYTLTYRRDDQTLTEEEVTEAFTKVTTALVDELNVTIR